MEVLRALKLPVPDDVLEQFCSDHATKAEFQEQYGHLDLSRVKWERRSVPAAVLLAVNTYPGFRQWPESVAARLKYFAEDGWDCIDVRSAVVAHWRTHLTWMRAPIVLEGALLGRPGLLHLAEGHTRIGLLRGLVEHDLVRADSRHEVWLGATSCIF